MGKWVLSCKPLHEALPQVMGKWVLSCKPLHEQGPTGAGTWTFRSGISRHDDASEFGHEPCVNHAGPEGDGS